MCNDQYSQIGGFKLIPESGILHDENGLDVQLRPQTFSVLLYLCENRQRVVSKQELLESVWANVCVTDDSIVQCIAEIRKALGPSHRGLLKTMPRRGYMLDDSEPKVQTEPAILPVISVQPFKFLNGWKSSNIAAGLTDYIVTELARQRDLTVCGGSGFVLDRSIPIRQALSPEFPLNQNSAIQYTLDGCVHLWKNRVRVTARLWDATNGSNIWANRYDEIFNSNLILQDLVGGAVVNSLVGSAGVIASRERSSARQQSVDDLNPFALYVLGSSDADLDCEVQNQRAIKSLTLAVQKDPEFHLAWRRLASIHLINACCGYTDNLNAEVKAYHIASRMAEKLDVDCGYTQATRASAHFHNGDPRKGLSAFDRALELNPDDASTLSMVAFARATKTAQAEADFELASQSMQQSPVNVNWNKFVYGRCAYHARKYEVAIDALQDLAAQPGAQLYLSLSGAAIGDMQSAATHRDGLLGHFPRFSIAKFVNGNAMCDSGAIKHFIDCAKLAGLPA